MINIPSEVLIANAFYAKQTDFIDYDELSDYKEILYKSLTKKEKYFISIVDLVGVLSESDNPRNY